MSDEGHDDGHDPHSYCTIDHANKQKEMAERTPYQFWLEHVKRKGQVFPDPCPYAVMPATAAAPRRRRA